VALLCLWLLVLLELYEAAAKTISNGKFRCLCHDVTFTRTCAILLCFCRSHDLDPWLNKAGQCRRRVKRAKSSERYSSKAARPNGKVEKYNVLKWDLQNSLLLLVAFLLVALALLLRGFVQLCCK